MAVNLLEVGSVGRALKVGRDQWEEQNGILDTQRKCADRCHKTCYVETANLGSVDAVVDMIRSELGRFKFGSAFKRERYVPPSPKYYRGDYSPNKRRAEEEVQKMIEAGEVAINCPTHWNLVGPGALMPCPPDCEFRKHHSGPSESHFTGGF